MQTKNFFQVMKDGTEIAVNQWIPDDDNIQGVIQFSHGMLEHSLRYDRLGCLFAEAGYVFSAHDHRGHGKTAEKAEADAKGRFGLLADKNGFDTVTEDISELITKLKSDYPNKKIVLLSHSFGSFVAQNFIEQKGSEVDAAILCGSSGKASKARAGFTVATIFNILRGRKYRSKFLQKLIFSGYSERVDEKFTEWDWLSRDKASVEMYMNDAWCGGTATVGFIKDIMQGLLKIHKKSAIMKIPKSLPIYIVSGSDDPVGEYTKTLENLAGEYKSSGIENLTVRFYEGARHEILNETNFEEVFKDMLDWIRLNLG